MSGSRVLRRPSQRDPALMARADHAALWALVEGAVADALLTHPEYLTDAGRRAAVRSITKRVVGQLVGRAKDLRREGRLGACPPAAHEPGDGLPSGRHETGRNGCAAQTGAVAGGGGVSPPPFAGAA